ncbi:uncharacterized protein RAG0_14405 [Rhynchosporium agropyri]|uniref:Uncharacterized protein n=1 Tax=Rhynchosporium agropyri TaxID=914238 RepID=A0A1E1LIY4_9HELO|nr:uncharacterized protein RAG0_14405 [Rhynchosporium agropyri]
MTTTQSSACNFCFCLISGVFTPPSLAISRTHSLVIYLSISPASLCGQMRDTDIYKEVTFNDPKPVLSFIFMRQVRRSVYLLPFLSLVQQTGCLVSDLEFGDAGYWDWRWELTGGEEGMEWRCDVTHVNHVVAYFEKLELERLREAGCR